MSMTISLIDTADNSPYPLDEHIRVAGTILLDSDVTEVMVTLNFDEHFTFVDSLHGRFAWDTVNVLTDAVNDLGVFSTGDPFEIVPGNIGYTCFVLLRWAQQFPEGIWNVE